MSTRFSILHATYRRPQKAFAAMSMWFERADMPEDIDYVFAVNADDPTATELRGLAANFMMPVRIISGDFDGSAEAWDVAAGISTGWIMIQEQDDVECPFHWDTELANRIPNMSVPTVVAVGDGYRKDRLMCTLIINRARYEQCGEFLHRGYLSVFSDDDATYRAYLDQRNGKCRVVEARDLTFLHRHHYHDKTVPMDETYAKENSQEAYAHGSQLFAARNPNFRTDGIRDWH